MPPIVPGELKRKYFGITRSRKRGETSEKNAGLREKRAKRKCGDLIKELKDKCFVNSELEEKLNLT